MIFDAYLHGKIFNFRMSYKAIFHQVLSFVLRWQLSPTQVKVKATQLILARLYMDFKVK